MSIRSEDAQDTYNDLRRFLLGATGEKDRMWHGYSHTPSNIIHLCNQLDHAMGWFALLKGKEWRDFGKYARWGPIGCRKFVDDNKPFVENLQVLNVWMNRFIEWVENPLFEPGVRLSGLVEDRCILHWPSLARVPSRSRRISPSLRQTLP